MQLHNYCTQQKGSEEKGQLTYLTIKKQGWLKTVSGTVQVGLVLVEIKHELIFTFIFPLSVAF